MKYMKSFIAHFSSNPAFNSQDAMRFLQNRGASAGYHKLVITNLLKEGKIHKITRGSYTFQDDVQYAGFAFRPFYYGLEDALSLLGLWEQETNPVILTPKKVRPGIRSFEGRNYIVRHISRKMFFGYSYIAYGEFNIPVSTIEKTLIDLLYFKVPISEEVVQNVLAASNMDILKGYAKEIPSSLKSRIAGLIRRKLP